MTDKPDLLDSPKEAPGPEQFLFNNGLLGGKSAWAQMIKDSSIPAGSDTGISIGAASHSTGGMIDHGGHAEAAAMVASVGRPASVPHTHLPA